MSRLTFRWIDGTYKIICKEDLKKYEGSQMFWEIVTKKVQMAVNKLAKFENFMEKHNIKNIKELENKINKEEE